MNWRLLLLVAACALPGCEAQPPRSATPAIPLPDDTLPPVASKYATEPTAGAALNGTGDLATHLLAALKERGDSPRGDARLAEVASFLANRGARGFDLDVTLVEFVARRVGFVGPTPWIQQIPLRQDGMLESFDAAAREVVSRMPRNIPVTRYGIAGVRTHFGAIVVVACSSVELEIEELPRHVAVHQRVALKGAIGPGFERATLSITYPGGNVKNQDYPRKIEAPLEFDEAGVHQIEVFGDGAGGPVVVANFPLYVGVDEPVSILPEKTTTARHLMASLLSPADIEARMLQLLNKARQDAHLPPLQVDPALADVARADATDMVDNRFFSHVSPTTGSPEDHLRRAHLRYPLVGENISLAASPEEGHDALMASPGHRANMLNPGFTHVGIGAVVDDEARGGGETVVFEFARERPIRIEDVPARVIEQMNAERARASLPPLKEDDSLARAARAGAAVLAGSPEASDEAGQSTRKALATTLKTSACIYAELAPDVWEALPPGAVSSPTAARIGVAAAPSDEGPQSFRLIIVVGGSPRMKMRCD